MSSKNFSRVCRGLTDLGPNAWFHKAECFRMMLLVHVYLYEYRRTDRNRQNTMIRPNWSNGRFWHFWVQMSQIQAAGQNTEVANMPIVVKRTVDAFRKRMQTRGCRPWWCIVYPDTEARSSGIHYETMTQHPFRRFPEVDVTRENDSYSFVK